jgi:hypothetical protein
MLTRPHPTVISQASGQTFENWLATPVGKAVEAAPHTWTLRRICKSPLATHVELTTPLSRLWLACAADEVRYMEWRRVPRRTLGEDQSLLSTARHALRAVSEIAKDTRRLGQILSQWSGATQTHPALANLTLADSLTRSSTDTDFMLADLRKAVLALTGQFTRMGKFDYASAHDDEELWDGDDDEYDRGELGFEDEYDIAEGHDFPSGKRIELPSEILAISPFEQINCDWLTSSYFRDSMLRGIRTSTISVCRWARTAAQIDYDLRFDVGGRFGRGCIGWEERRPDMRDNFFFPPEVARQNAYSGVTCLRDDWRRLRFDIMPDFEAMEALRELDEERDYARIKARDAFGNIAFRSDYFAYTHADELELLARGTP